MGLNKNQLDKLVKDGKIRSFVDPGKGSKAFSSDNIPPGARTRSKAKEWLGWNLPYFANEHGLTLETEFKFCTDRDWRFDFAIPALKIAVEYEGGIFMQKSGHSNVHGFVKDSEKYNRATVLGWRLIRVTYLNYQTVIHQLKQLLK
jgi:hypothetical protein